MADTIYRYEEISTGKKVFWIVSIVLILGVSISLIIYGRGIQTAAANKLAEENTERRNAEEKAKAEQIAKAEESRQLEAKRLSGVRTLKELANKYYTLPGLVPYSGDEYIKGKVLVLDRTAESIADLNSSLPSDLRAATVAEVGTIVWLDWGQELAVYYGDYFSLDKGYRYTCQVTVIDRSLPAKVGSQHFLGSDPPSQVYASKYGRDYYGSKPTSEIIAYLKSLPRR